MKKRTYIGLLYNDYTSVTTKLFFKADNKQQVIDWIQSYFPIYIKENEPLIYYSFQVEKEQNPQFKLNFYDSISYKKYKESCFFSVEEIEGAEEKSWIKL